MIENKALIAMSGGVDSAVAALLLKDKYDLTGITMRLWCENEMLLDGECLFPDENCIEAKKIADMLGFLHISTDLGATFYESVIKKFIEEYRQGRTPNPCIECNKKLKFGKLFDIAKAMDIPYLATGHYARIIKTQSGEYQLFCAKDASKDQSYFLWGIKKELLPFILFPLGDYTKAQIRSLAEENGFTNAHRSDSQDICFIPDGDYVSFIEKYDAPCDKQGDFVDTCGNVLGRHSGIERYTVGQRKGLGIALGIPMFVGSKDAEKNTVTLCSDRELYSSSLYADSVNLLTDLPKEKEIRILAKVRYRHVPANATLKILDNSRAYVEFDEPQRAISAGQSVVFYDGERVLGGGIIE